MKYISTRGENLSVSDKEVLFRLWAKDGGLYVPSFLPKLRKEFFEDLQKLPFLTRLVKMTGLFLPSLPSQSLLKILEKRFRALQLEGRLPKLSPFTKYQDKYFLYEAWQGDQGSIKEWIQEYALSCLELALKEDAEVEQLFLVHAEGGNQLGAFVSASKERKGFVTFSYVPQQSLNRIQKHLVRSVLSETEEVVSLQANYEQSQDVLRQILKSEKLEQTLQKMKTKMSSTASYSFLHILGYLVLFASMFADHLLWYQEEKKKYTPHSLEEGTEEEKEFWQKKAKAYQEDLPSFNFVLADGDLADVMAAYYLMQMGVPIKKILVASNKNKSFSDFLRTGQMENKKKSVSTMAQAGDVVYALNLERLLFEATKRDGEKVKEFLKNLMETGKATLESEALKRLQKFFVAGFADNVGIQSSLKEMYDRFDLCLEPHTALGINVYSRYQIRAKDDSNVLFCMAYSPYVYTKAVAEALLDKKTVDFLQEEKNLIEALSFETDMAVPKSLLSYLGEYVHSCEKREQLSLKNKEELKTDIYAYLDYENQSLSDGKLYQNELFQKKAEQAVTANKNKPQSKKAQEEKQEQTDLLSLSLLPLGKEEFKEHLLKKLEIFSIK